MMINYRDYLVIVESIRQKLDDPQFTKVERDLVLYALGLAGARVPGKVESEEKIIPPTTLAASGGVGGTGGTRLYHR